jgi:AraC-like DNA-binding protein
LCRSIKTVAWIFERFVKKEKGKMAIEHIHFHLLSKAKYLLLSSDMPIQELAFQLGFEYVQYFNKLFNKGVGVSINQYRMLN